MKRTNLAVIAVDAEARAFASLLDGGFIDIYDGAMPGDAASRIGAQKLGVSLELGNPAFSPPIDGVIFANPITSGIAKADINPATWARVYRSDHRTVVMDITVGVTDANLIVPTTNIAAGVLVSCSSFSHHIAKANVGT